MELQAERSFQPSVHKYEAESLFPDIWDIWFLPAEKIKKHRAALEPKTIKTCLHTRFYVPMSLSELLLLKSDKLL